MHKIVEEDADEEQEEFHLWVHFPNQSQKFEDYPDFNAARCAAADFLNRRTDASAVTICRVRTEEVLFLKKVPAED
jgi:hypothetical protein